MATDRILSISNIGIYIGVTTNTGNAYTASSPPIGGFTVNGLYNVTFNVGNTGSATLNGYTIHKNGSALAGGDFVANQDALLRWDGTYFNFATAGASGGATTPVGAAIWDSPHLMPSTDNGYQGFTIFSRCVGGFIHCFPTSFKVSVYVRTAGASLQIGNCVILKTARGAAIGVATVISSTSIPFASSSFPVTLTVTGGELDAVSDAVAYTFDPLYDYWLAVYFTTPQPSGSAINLAYAPQISNYTWQAYWIATDHTGDSTIPAATFFNGVLAFHDALAA